MIPYSKSKLNFRRNLPSETYHPKKKFQFLIKNCFFKIKMYLQVTLKKVSKNFLKLTF